MHIVDKKLHRYLIDRGYHVTGSNPGGGKIIKHTEYEHTLAQHQHTVIVGDRFWQHGSVTVLKKRSKFMWDFEFTEIDALYERLTKLRMGTP